MEEDCPAVVVNEGENADGMQLEALENNSECVVAEVKTEVIDPEALQMAPQQYIIVAPHEAGTAVQHEMSVPVILPKVQVAGHS